MVAGPAGSGKSTLGRALARRTGAVLLDQDVATNPLMSQIATLVGAGQDLDHPALRGSVRTARYRCLVDIAVDNRRLGRSVVMIAPFTAECADAAAWSALVGQLSPARVILVWVSVDRDLALARRRRRNLSRDSALTAEASLPPPVPEPVVHYLPADGAADPTSEATRLMAEIERVVRPDDGRGAAAGG